MKRTAYSMIAAAVTITAASMLGYHHDAGSGITSQQANASTNARDNAARAELEAFDWNITPALDAATVALNTLATATDAALVADAITAPVALVTTNHLALAAVEGTISIGQRFAFPPRPGTYEVIGITGKGYRVQLVSADGTRLLARRTFTANCYDWADAVTV